MAVELGQFKMGLRKKKEAESLASALERESQEESSLQSILGLAIPLIASVALPFGGGLLAGGLGSKFMASGLGKLATSALGKMALGTVGTRALGEGIESLARSKGYGGDAKSIAESAGLFGRREAKKYAGQFTQMQPDNADKWLSSMLSGANLSGIDTSKLISGLDKMTYNTAEKAGRKAGNFLDYYLYNLGFKKPEGLGKYEIGG